MDKSLRERAARFVDIVPRLHRLMYNPREDSLLEQLPVAQFRMLRLLDGASRTITSIGEELGLTASAVTQMANRLQEAGFVSRNEDIDDRRVKHLSLTAKAQEMMNIRSERRIKTMSEILQQLPPERQQQIIDGMEELLVAGGGASASHDWHNAELDRSFVPSPRQS